MFEKSDRRYPLSIKKGTQDVPNDGKYHVVEDGTIVLSTAVYDYAIIIFEEKREEHRKSAGHLSGQEVIARESARREMRAMRAEGVASREKRNRGGGPGGRGGA
jgi:hypothetical protein